MSVLLSYAVVGVIPIFVALHLSYVRRRAAQEKTQTPRRAGIRCGFSWPLTWSAGLSAAL